jgi:hypothetical protein
VDDGDGWVLGIIIRVEGLRLDREIYMAGVLLGLDSGHGHDVAIDGYFNDT